MKLKVLLLTAICAALMSACHADNAPKEDTVFAMDTVMTLKAYGENAETAISEAKDEIFSLDKKFDRGNAESEIYKINNEQSAAVSDETAALIASALKISAETEGDFDISVAPVMDLWGFYSKDFHVPEGNELSAAMEKVGYKNIRQDKNTISLANGAMIDLGGIAKGFLSDRIIEIFRNNGVQSGIISLGGNVHALGSKDGKSAWNVAIQNPDEEGYIGNVKAQDKAVVTSGGYRRFFEADGVKYHHIIDPKTGFSANNGMKSVSVIADSGTIADALSTALFVMGLQKAEEFWRAREDFEAVFMTDDDKIYITEGLLEIFESEDEYSVIRRGDSGR